MGLDKELWDILEDGVGDLVLDDERAAIDRKKHTPAQKNLYKKHHKIKGSLVTTIPKVEYMKMSDKEDNVCFREAKTLMLVDQYELFKMKDGESIEQCTQDFRL